MHIEFLVLISVCISLSNSQTNEYGNVLFTKKFLSKRNKISEAKHDSFYEFLQITDILIDKSLFIKDLLTNHRKKCPTMLITTPRRFGKTTNLQMLEFFLQPEMKNDSVIPQKQTKSYEFFVKGKITTKKGKTKELNNPPAISKHENLIENHLAKYPVIHLDYSRINSMFHYREFLKEFRRIISAVFEKHETAVKHLCLFKRNINNDSVAENICFEKDYEEFVKIRKRKEKDEISLVDCFLSLSRLLKEYYGKPVVILIDEYDGVITRLYTCDSMAVPERDKHYVEDFFSKFLERTFKTNENIFMGILTGIFPLVLNFNDGGVNAQHFTHASKEFFRYYGFTIEEVEKLWQVMNISEEVTREAYALYNGYQVENDTQIRLYDCLSITKFTNSRKLDYYWTTDDNQHYQKVGKHWLPLDNYYIRNRILQHEQNQEMLGELLIGRCVLHSPIRRLEIYEFGQIELLLKERALFHKFVIFGVSFRELSFWFMNAAGYLTMIEHNNGSCCSKIANEERRRQIALFFFELELKHEWEKSTIQGLQNMMFNYTEGVYNFLKEYKKMLVKYTTNREFTMHELLILYQTEFISVVKKTAMIYGYNFTADLPLNSSDAIHPHPHLVIFNETRAIIFEIKFHTNNEKSKDIIDQQLLPCCRAYFTNNVKTKFLTCTLVNFRLKTKEILFKNFNFQSYSDIIQSNASMISDVNLESVLGVPPKWRTYKPKEGIF